MPINNATFIIESPSRSITSQNQSDDGVNRILINKRPEHCPTRSQDCNIFVRRAKSFWSIQTVEFLSSLAEEVCQCPMI